MHNISPVTAAIPPDQAAASPSSPAPNPAARSAQAVSELAAWSNELLDQQRTLSRLQIRTEQPASTAHDDLAQLQRQKKNLQGSQRQAQTELDGARSAVNRNLAEVERTEQKLGKKLRVLEELVDSCHHPLPTRGVEDVLRQFPNLRTSAVPAAPFPQATADLQMPPPLAQPQLSPEEEQRVEYRSEAIGTLQTGIAHAMQLSQMTRRELVTQERLSALVAQAATSHNTSVATVVQRYYLRTVTDHQFQLAGISGLLAHLEIIKPPEQAKYDDPALFDKLLVHTTELRATADQPEACFKHPPAQSDSEAAYYQFPSLVALLGLSKTNKFLFDLIKHTAEVVGEIGTKYPLAYRANRNLGQVLSSEPRLQYLSSKASDVILTLAAQVTSFKADIDDVVSRKAKLRLNQADGKHAYIKGQPLLQLQEQYARLSDLLRNNADTLIGSASLSIRDRYIDSIEQADLIHERNRQSVDIRAQIRPGIASDVAEMSGINMARGLLERERENLLVQQREALAVSRAPVLAESSVRMPAGAAAPATPATTATLIADADTRRARLLGEMAAILEQNRHSTEAHATAAANWTSSRARLLRVEEDMANTEAALAEIGMQSRAAFGDARQARQQQAAEIQSLQSALANVTGLSLRADPRVKQLMTPTALTTVLQRHLGRSEAQLRERFYETGAAAIYASTGALLRALADIWNDAQRRIPALLAAGSRADFDQRRQLSPLEPRDLLCRHDDVLGQGINHGTDKPVEAFISCYSLDWDREHGRVMVSHLYPSVPRR